jgi:hypothetical protein
MKPYYVIYWFVIVIGKYVDQWFLECWVMLVRKLLQFSTLYYWFFKMFGLYLFRWLLAGVYNSFVMVLEWFLNSLLIATRMRCWNEGKVLTSGHHWCLALTVFIFFGTLKSFEYLHFLCFTVITSLFIFTLNKDENKNMCTD